MKRSEILKAAETAICKLIETAGYVTWCAVMGRKAIEFGIWEDEE